MGSSLLGGTQKSTSKSEPWAAQQPYLKDAFANAQANYNAKKGTSWYDGDLYAGMDDLTKQGVSGIGSYATGTGTDAAGRVTSTAGDLLGSTGDYLGSIGALNDLARADPTQSNIASASAYAANPYIDQQIDAASRDVVRNLNENDLPAIDRAATGTGNINSTRAGIASGIAMRGAQDRIGDIASTMRGDAYNQGLSLAENSRQANMSGLGSAASLYGGALGQGFDASALGQQMAYDNYGQLVNAGQLNQADAQGQLDADFQKWQGNDTRANELLNQYYGIIGGNNWGGTTQTKTKGGPGILATLMGGASTAASVYAGFGGGK